MHASSPLCLTQTSSSSSVSFVSFSLSLYVVLSSSLSLSRSGFFFFFFSGQQRAVSNSAIPAHADGPRYLKANTGVQSCLLPYLSRLKSISGFFQEKAVEKLTRNAFAADKEEKEDSSPFSCFLCLTARRMCFLWCLETT